MEVRCAVGEPSETSTSARAPAKPAQRQGQMVLVTFAETKVTRVRGPGAPLVYRRCKRLRSDSTQL